MRSIPLSSKDLVEGIVFYFEGFPNKTNVEFKQHDSHGLQVVIDVNHESGFGETLCITPEKEEGIIVGRPKAL